jgi:hypothetical protein
VHDPARRKRPPAVKWSRISFYCATVNRSPAAITWITLGASVTRPLHLPQRPGDVPRVEERRHRVTGLGGHELELPVSDLGVGLGQCRFLREAPDGGDEGFHVFVAAKDGDGGAAPGGAAVAAAEQRGDLAQGAV